MASEAAWQITVVLIVAVIDEFHEVLDSLRSIGKEVETSDEDVHRRFYFQEDDVVVQVLLAKLPDASQGGDVSAVLAARLAERYKPFLLALVGLCAGHPVKTRLGDVVVASATVRHDFGKLGRERRLIFWRRLTFKHRREPLRIRGDFVTDLLNLFDKKKFDFRVTVGVISTGNQVTRLPKIFEYLAENVLDGVVGDEYDRAVLALEMEAHAVAYAAEKSGVPRWLIVKGVCDHADDAKSDSHHTIAVRNAAQVVQDITSRIVVSHFKRDRRLDALRFERAAATAFEEGEIEQAATAAAEAHQLGRRSPIVRRRYVFQSLTQYGRYIEASEILDQYEETGILNDRLTRELRVTILWRAGYYREALGLLGDDVIEGDRQLLYLRAMNEVFFNEPASYIQLESQFGAATDHFHTARNLLETALRIDDGPTPWWIWVNLYWVLRVLHASEQELQRVFVAAKASVDSAIAAVPSKGVPRLYRLFLLATAGRKDEFKRLILKRDEVDRVHLALEAVDMVYLRLKVLRGRLILNDQDEYWFDICDWLRRVRTIGRPARYRDLGDMR